MKPKSGPFLKVSELESGSGSDRSNESDRSTESVDLRDDVHTAQGARALGMEDDDARRGAGNVKDDDHDDSKSGNRFPVDE